MDVCGSEGFGHCPAGARRAPEKPALAYNSILTTIRVLENKATLNTSKMAGPTSISPSWKREATRPNPALGQPFLQEFPELLVPNFEDLLGKTRSRKPGTGASRQYAAREENREEK
jgi:hypothetical protein